MTFEVIQQSFIDYIKEPTRALPTGTQARRMKIYRDLFFNNVNGFVTSAFPVLNSLYDEEDWLALVQCFFAVHDCKTPIFIEIAQEFVHFLQTEYEFKQSDPQFITELAHYEYMELVVAVAKDNPQQAYLEQDDIPSASLCLSDSARVLQYHFDVQKISEDYRPDTPAQNPPLFCLYRDSEDEVIFLQLNPLTAQVLGMISQHDSIGFDALVTWLEQAYPQMDKEMLFQGCSQMLAALSAKGVIKHFSAQ